MGFNDINLQVSGPQQPASTYKTKVLKGQVPFATQVTEPNTKYVIKHKFDLDGGSVAIPEGCLLEFDGGAISNGTLVGQSTILIYSQPLDDILTATLEGSWRHESGVKADEEDITDLNGELKFKDKAYIPANYSGLGRKILRKNIVNGVNTLTQSMINGANTIYIIQYDFTLGEDITIPADCILEFDGGSLNGEAITFNNTIVENPNFSGISFSGSLKNSTIDVVGFGADNTGTNDCTNVLNNLLSLAKSNQKPYKYYFKRGSYKITSPLIVFGGWENIITIEGDDRTHTAIVQYTDNTPIFCIGEMVNISKLTLAYANQQSTTDTDSIVFSYKRIIYSIIEEIDIWQAHTIFKVYDYNFDPNYNPDQTLVNVNVSDLFIRKNTGYFLKGGSGSGSVFTNIYYSGLGNTEETPSLGCINVSGASCCFNQFNIENIYCNEVPINGDTFNYLTFTLLHYEHISCTGLISAANTTEVIIDVITAHDCTFRAEYTMLFYATYSRIDIGTIKITEPIRTSVLSMYLANSNNQPAIFNFGKIETPANFINSGPRTLNIHYQRNFINIGNTSQRPILLSNEVTTYFDTDLNLPIFCTKDRAWIGYDGYTAAKHRGTTAERPKATRGGGPLTIYDVGFMYFDTDLLKPIYAKVIHNNSGEAGNVDWIDATGATV